ncbi:cytochrome C biogenesis protein [Pseudoroseomonas deserti]|uniref:Cytochrome C biogenesis protein n=1 Tax=Teichococcus deserti TaxID=1817963 RepID=A0A1V2GUH6_9PROT|nr:redoxin family protein [Pseudoroseomonas deserti]ONG45086.1 cytochrome C biogenesis protein [Pseudoroseomonas deserti]
MTFFLLAYLAGVLTILSPCILPVLPFILARADRPFRQGTLPLLAGLALGFVLVASLGAVAGGWAVDAHRGGRAVALALLALSGLALLWPGLATRLAAPLARLGDRLGGRAAMIRSPRLAALLLGLATGLVWAPCAGPVLGLILTGAALQGPGAQSTLLLAGSAAGAATVLGLATALGQRLLRALPGILPAASGLLRRGLGGLAVLAVIAIGLGLDTRLLARTPLAGAAPLEQALVDALQPGEAPAMPPQPAALPVLGTLPGLDGAVAWLNTPPLTPQALRGKVVLVNFWTYSCINCLRSLPHLRAWAQRYADQGLVVLGVHTPEFAFERDAGNVRRALRDLDIAYPVAVDSRFALWRAFGNSAWPAFYLVDAEGRLRHVQAGEGGEARLEAALRALLAEAGGAPAAAPPVALRQPGAQAAPDFARLRSPESYLGYRQAQAYAGREPLRQDAPQSYRGVAPGLNGWSLDGRWTVGGEQAVLDAAGGGILMRFQARDLHLVMGARDAAPRRFRVTIDGQPPGADHGADTDAAGFGTIDGQRLYQLLRQKAEVRPRLFEIRFLDAGAEAYAFTFG